ncbi:MAG: hypothetical protein WC812_02945 [Candidatus Pacearchaeota archaeon]|jgi:hypothetical protein
MENINDLIFYKIKSKIIPNRNPKKHFFILENPEAKTELEDFVLSGQFCSQFDFETDSSNNLYGVYLPKGSESGLIYLKEFKSEIGDFVFIQTPLNYLDNSLDLKN